MIDTREKTKFQVDSVLRSSANDKQTCRFDAREVEIMWLSLDKLQKVMISGPITSIRRESFLLLSGTHHLSLIAGLSRW